MERQILQNKTESHKLQTMEQHEMKETAQKSRSSANSKSNTGSMADNTSSSESEFGSYCEITNIKTNKMSLVERQNSQNEEREGLLGAQTQEIHTSPVQGLSQTETCGKCVGNQHYKCENEHVIDMIDAEKELYEQIDSKKFPSTTDTDWTESSISKTKKSKPKRVRNCSSCCCTITLSTVFSVVISVSLMFILLRYSGDTAMMREIQGPAQVPNIGQVGFSILLIKSPPLNTIISRLHVWCGFEPRTSIHVRQAKFRLRCARCFSSAFSHFRPTY